MINPPFANTPPPARLMIFAGLFMISLVLTFVLGIFLLNPLFGVNATELPSLLDKFDNPVAMDVLKFLQLLQGLLAFILPAIVMAELTDRRPFNFLKLDHSATSASYIYVIILSLAIMPLINYLGEFNSKMVFPEALKGLEHWMRDSEDKAAKFTGLLLDMPDFSSFIYIFTMVAILPAIGEELVFRGIIQRTMKDWTRNKHWSIFITAFLFSSIHMQFFGFVPRFVLGMMLGYLFEWSGSLWLNILAHFINNGAAVIFAYLLKKDQMAFDPDKIGVEGNVLPMVLCSTLVGAALLFAVYRRENKSRMEHG